MVWLMLVGFVVFGALSTLAFKRKAERDSDLRRLAAAGVLS